MSARQYFQELCEFNFLGPDIFPRSFGVTRPCILVVRDDINSTYYDELCSKNYTLIF